MPPPTVRDRGTCAAQVTTPGHRNAAKATRPNTSSTPRALRARNANFMRPNVRAEPAREAGRPWPAADNELATRLPAKGGLPRGVGSRANTKGLPQSW
jgi:hypothetical protein